MGAKIVDLKIRELIGEDHFYIRMPGLRGLRESKERWLR